MVTYDTSLADGQIDALCKSLFDMEIDYQAINDSILNLCKALSSSMVKILTENYVELLTASLFALIESVRELPIDELQEESYISVPEEKLEPLREMAQLVPEEKREEFQKIIAPEEGKKPKIITLENLYKIAMLVLTIITLIRPVSIDGETKQIMREQNEIGQRQVEINLERNEIERQKAASLDKLAEGFMEFVEYVKETGICVSKQVDTIQHDIDTIPHDADNFPNSIDMID